MESHLESQDSQAQWLFGFEEVHSSGRRAGIQKLVYLRNRLRTRDEENRYK
jgi:hypothetical protein